MEHVPGVPITDYCDQRRLDTKARLKLFERVCEGVQHALGKEAIRYSEEEPTNAAIAAKHKNVWFYLVASLGKLRVGGQGSAGLIWVIFS